MKAAASIFKAQRLGIVMRPNPTKPEEDEGVLNPGAARAPDGELYLFPRLVGKNNYSRIGIARVLFNDDGTAVGVERKGIALEPTEPYELRPKEGSGGVEDPRVTFVEPLSLYVMAYVAWGPDGPRVAVAVSENCLKWQRIGLVDFQPDPNTNYGVSLNQYDNKDAAFGPTAVDHTGSTALVLVHRPAYDQTNAPRGVSPYPAIWVSYCSLDEVKRDVRALRIMKWHAIVAEPKARWESLRIGLGTPPVHTRLGYMTIYHGVSGKLATAVGESNQVQYDAGIMIFRREGERFFSYRSPTPVLIPQGDEERIGTAHNVVFPTGIDKRSEDVYDVYYGMADQRIGIARLWLPEKVKYEELEMPSVQSSASVLQST